MIHDFRFINEEDPDLAAQKILETVEKKFSSDVDPIRDIQVLSPMHNGSAGAINLNQVLQNALNPSKGKRDTLEYYGRAFRIGDRVMQIKNNYEKDIFNGDIGFIHRVDEEKGEIAIMFDRLIPYKINELDEIQHAYAVTIHKSQGSEYPIVIMPILTQHYMMLRRNLLYTGITRARKLVVIVGSKRAMNIAIRRDDVGKRNTNLEARIRELIR
jgi:exodeoxyribonuclease V alpha subunit